MRRRIQRLPNASGGGSPPDFKIANPLWKKIKDSYLASADLSDKPPEFPAQFRSELTKATQSYLWTVSLSQHAKPISTALQLVNRFLHNFQELNTSGDIGDYIKAVFEQHFRYRLISRGGRKAPSAPSAVDEMETAFVRTRDEIVSDADAGHNAGDDWGRWVKRIAEICQSHGLPTGVRKDVDKNPGKPSPFVALVRELQTCIPEEYRRSQPSSAEFENNIALSEAINRARRVTKAAPMSA
jgi:hypothetical protein